MARSFAFRLGGFVPSVATRGALVVCGGLAAGSRCAGGGVPDAGRLAGGGARGFAALVAGCFVPTVIGGCFLVGGR